MEIKYLKMNKKMSVNALKTCLKVWKKKAYCDKDGHYCGFCEMMIKRIENNIIKVNNY